MLASRLHEAAPYLEDGAPKTSLHATPHEDARAYLVMLAAAPRLFTLPAAGIFRIGRAPESELCLEDAATSRRHVELVLEGSAVTLVELGSRNGTRVNGAFVHERCPLGSGDVIALPSATLVFHAVVRPIGAPSPLHPSPPCSTPECAAAQFRPLRDELRELERTRMAQALLVTRGNRTRAAKLVNMPIRTFMTKLKAYDLDGGSPRVAASPERLTER